MGTRMGKLSSKHSGNEEEIQKKLVVRLLLRLNWIEMLSFFLGENSTQCSVNTILRRGDLLDEV